MFSVDMLTPIYYGCLGGGFAFFSIAAFMAGGHHVHVHHHAHGHVGHGAGHGGHGALGRGAVSGHGTPGHGVVARAPVPTHGGHAPAGGHAGGAAGARLNAPAAGHAGTPGTHGAAGHSGTPGTHGAGHSGAPGTNGAAGHSGAPGTQAGAAARGGAPAHSAGHAARANQSAGQQATGGGNELITTRSSQALTGHLHPPHELHRISIVEVLLGIFNPMRIALFLFFFGAAGRSTELILPIVGPLSLVPAVIVGAIGSNIVLHLFGVLVSKLQASSLSVVEETVGQLAEVTVPITEGRTGQITYIVNQKRNTSAAKPYTPGTEFQKGAEVFIATIENNIAYVEPWDDDFNTLENPDSRIAFPIEDNTKTD